jgi:AcrR family transcriptional regulator
MMRSVRKSFTVRQAVILAALYLLSMATKAAANRIAERKLRDKQARRAQIISAARRIAELEGWSNVTVRRLSDEISYSQPVLYAHFGSREGILAAVAIEGFQELGLALEKARKRVKRGSTVESVAAAYLEFAASSPALYEVMFSLSLSVPFGDAATPPELRFAFSQFLELFPGQSSKAEVLSELFWASLHGVAELSRTRRFPPSRQKERVRTLVELFTFPRNETAQVVKAR